MKKFTILLMILVLVSLSYHPGLAQEETEKQETTTAVTQIDELTQEGRPTYQAEGRRDPFRNLLAGLELEESLAAKGIPDILIDDVVLAGIVKAKGEFTAIINAGEGFPFYIKRGDRLADGYVRLITDTQVIFRKTMERGIRLIEPKEITKVLFPEEQ
jgi:Tfp pilus assembly protein PilP